MYDQSGGSVTMGEYVGPDVLEAFARSTGTTSLKIGSYVLGAKGDIIASESLSRMHLVRKSSRVGSHGFPLRSFLELSTSQSIAWRPTSYILPPLLLLTLLGSRKAESPMSYLVIDTTLLDTISSAIRSNHKGYNDLLERNHYVHEPPAPL